MYFYIFRVKQKGKRIIFGALDEHLDFVYQEKSLEALARKVRRRNEHTRGMYHQERSVVIQESDANLTLIPLAPAQQKTFWETYDKKR